MLRENKDFTHAKVNVSTLESMQFMFRIYAIYVLRKT